MQLHTEELWTLNKPENMMMCHLLMPLLTQDVVQPDELPPSH